MKEIENQEEEKSAVEYLFRKYMDRGQKLYLSDFIEASNIEQQNFDNKQNHSNENIN